MRIISKRNSRLLNLIIVGFALLFSASSSAQIVNIESKRIGADEEGWNGSLDFGFNLTQNVQKVWQISNRAGVLFQKGKHRLLFLNDYNLVKANESDLLNRGFEHIRYGYSLGEKKRLALEVFEQAQYNRVQKIKLRLLTGLGPRINIANTDSIDISFGSLPMVEYEELTDNTTIERSTRLSSYISFNIRLLKKIELKSITYFQPKFTEPDDFRLSNESSLALLITDRINFKISYNLLYDSEPPAGIPKTVYELIQSLNFQF